MDLPLSQAMQPLRCPGGIMYIDDNINYSGEWLAHNSNSISISYLKRKTLQKSKLVSLGTWEWGYLSRKSGLMPLYSCVGVIILHLFCISCARVQGYTQSWLQPSGTVFKWNRMGQSWIALFLFIFTVIQHQVTQNPSACIDLNNSVMRTSMQAEQRLRVFSLSIQGDSWCIPAVPESHHSF